MVSERWRAVLLQLAAPAAVLAVATVAVVLVREAVHGGRADAKPTRAAPPLANKANAQQRDPARPQLRYYVVQRGDTLGAIALDLDTTVERLLALNPGVDPAALRVGHKLRIG